MKKFPDKVLVHRACFLTFLDCGFESSSWIISSYSVFQYVEISWIWMEID